MKLKVMIKQESKEKILRKAISLEKLGLNDLAWNQNDAIELIESLMNEEIGIFGGDVFALKLESFSPTGENWHCDPEPGESRQDFYLRSKKKAINYISHFPVNDNLNEIFIMIFTEIID